jgi:septum formation protein
LDIILASTSKIRRTILANAGVPFAPEDPKFDEAQAKLSMMGLDAKTVALSLAVAKSKAVSLQVPSALVIGADQTLDFHGRIFDKPSSLEEASQQLVALRNGTHSLFSALCCSIAGKTIWTYSDEAKLTMRNFTNEFLERYLVEISNSYSSSVGGYKLEGYGISLFDHIEGDYFTIMGLPILPLLNFLRQEKYIAS